MNIIEQSERDQWKLLGKAADAVRIGHNRPSIEREDSFRESTVQSKASPECIKCTTLRAPRRPSYNNMYIRENEGSTAEKNRRSTAPVVPENVKISTGADIV